MSSVKLIPKCLCLNLKDWHKENNPINSECMDNVCNSLVNVTKKFEVLEIYLLLVFELVIVIYTTFSTTLLTTADNIILSNL